MMMDGAKAGLHNDLKAGGLIAMALLGPENRITVPAVYWPFLKLDFEHDRAHGLGITLYDVIIGVKSDISANQLY